MRFFLERGAVNIKITWAAHARASARYNEAGLCRSHSGPHQNIRMQIDLVLLAKHLADEFPVRRGGCAEDHGQQEEGGWG